MADMKFGNDERKQVIVRLEALKNIKLLPVGNSKKFLKGSDGSHYCIVGGTGDWHGIPKEVLEQGNKDSANFYLVIARWLKTEIQIYMGPLKPLIDRRESLTKNYRGDFQFDLNTPTNNILSIKQVPTATFRMVDKFADPLSQFKLLSKETRDQLLAAAGVSSKAK